MSENQSQDKASKETKSKETKTKEKSEVKKFSQLFEKQKTFFASAILVVVAFSMGFLAGGFATPTGMLVGSQFSADQIAQQGVDFLNAYFVQTGEVTLGGFEDDGDLILVNTNYQGQDIPVQMTRDGRYIILSGIGAVNMEEYAAEAGSLQNAPPAAEGPDIPKSDVPVVNLFVMSHCPYGLQAQKALVPVMELLGDKADIEINFVHYIMHGMDEVIDNNIEYCIQRDQPEKLTEYLRCFVEAGNRESCFDQAGIDTNALDSCEADLEEQFNVTGIYESSTERYPPYLVDAILAQQYGVSGSPTLVINGKIVSVSRSADAFKQAVCSAFNEAPEECSTTLVTSQEAPSFGPVGSGSASATGSATCG